MDRIIGLSLYFSTLYFSTLYFSTLFFLEVEGLKFAERFARNPATADGVVVTVSKVDEPGFSIGVVGGEAEGAAVPAGVVFQIDAQNDDQLSILPDGLFTEACCGGIPEHFLA